MLQLTPTQSLATIDRPVELLMRSDLLVSIRRMKGKTYYILKDPLTLAHHQLWEEEYALLKMLDGKTTLAQMKEMFTKQFTNSRLDLRRLQWLHGQFHRNGLIVSNGVGQSTELLRRESAQKWRERKSKFTQWMAIRFRGFNPDPMLESIDKQFGWVFTPSTMIASLVAILFTLCFLTANSSTFLAKLPRVNEYITVNNGIWLFVAFSLLKVIHEFGHGLACKHFGSECNEMGIMLLLFTPCLYCDVSDSWMIEQRWKRAMIAMAGIWFEMIAASLCAWIWWFSNPGIVNSLCFHAMIVGSVGTLLFNGNPLLKYDGYFVLSDLWDRPNLAQSARQALRDWLSRCFLINATQPGVDPAGRGPTFLVGYALLSMLYRYVLMCIILFFLYRIFAAAHLELVGAFLIASVLVGAAVRITRDAANIITTPGRMKQLRKGRVTLTALVVIALIATVLWLPLPTHVNAPIYVTIRNAKNIVVIVEGTLRQCAPEGTTVRAGDIIAKLESRDLELNLSARRGELSRLRARLNGLESRRGEDITISPQIPTVREAIAGLEVEVQRLEAEAERLILRSPVDGIVIACEQVSAPEQTDGLRRWSGRPLDNENIGCFLKSGTTICQVGPMGPREGTVFLHQGQVELVRAGQAVRVKSKEQPGTAFRGSVKEVGSSEVTELPPEVLRSAIIPHSFDAEGKSRTIEPTFVASVELESSPNNASSEQLMHQSIGEASIAVAPESIGTRVKRLIYETFAFDPTVQQRSNR